MRKSTYAQKIGGIFACVTAIICGGFIFTKGFPDISVLKYGFSLILPASFLTGFAGFLIGKVFDNENKKNMTGQTFK